MRDEDFTSKLPEEIKDAFIEESDLSKEKLAKLKENLREQFPVGILLTGHNNNSVSNGI